MSKFLPSEQASSALALAQKTIKKQGTTTNTDIFKADKHTGHTEDSLKTCIAVFENLAKTIATSSLKATFRKFKSPKYLEVARLVGTEIPSQ